MIGRVGVEAKICGLCRPEDAAVADAAGADYVGVVLAVGGPRSRSAAEATDIYEAAPRARRVGVFVDPEPDEALGLARRLSLDVVQLHGRESPALVRRLRAAGPWRVWKAVRPRRREEFRVLADPYDGCVDALLVEGHSERAAGGTGTRFAWDELAPELEHRPSGIGLVVAGGLTPDNVGRAVARFAPDVVDVSSGVERTVGEKSERKVRAFIERVRATARPFGG